MSKMIGKGPCPKCDADYGYTTNNEIVSLYEDDEGNVNGTCWSCKSYHRYDTRLDKEAAPAAPAKVEVVDTDVLPYGTSADRKISKEVAEMYGVTHTVNKDGEVDTVYYPYSRESGDPSYKVRSFPKSFKIQGGVDKLKLFGQDVVKTGMKLVITEGEEDTLAVAQSYKDYNGKVWPVVSIQSSSNLAQIAEQRDWIRKFDEIVMYIDKDDAGQKAINKIAKMIGYDKTLKVAAGVEKDASDEYVKHGHKNVMQAIWNATQYNPQGILTSAGLWDQVQSYSKIESVAYPQCFQGLNDKLKGMRGGEITLWTSGTGAGKSTMLREIALFLSQNTEDKIGIISLEESPAETAKKLAAMVLNKNSAMQELSLEELKPAFDSVFGDDRILVLDHQGAITENIVDQLNYMASVGCKYVFVDHITILVSEGADGLTGNEAVDKVMNDLLRVAKTHNVWIGLVSHLRKMGTAGKSFEQGTMPSLDDIRGSGSIKQISNDIIAFARNSEEGDNKIQMRVLKCRHTGLTGNAGTVAFDLQTGRLHPSAIEDTMNEDYF